KNIFEIIKKVNPDIICFGYDQKIPEGFDEWLIDNNLTIQVKRLDSYKDDRYKSSKLKGIIHQ
ncbi:MAG: hypothetical protein NT001_04245, partial [Candidatus Woesearchaeota archaeon]|nr:hypothetical protein [Candidatus Woesearchaeota archaeon]